MLPPRRRPAAPHGERFNIVLIYVFAAEIFHQELQPFQLVQELFARVGIAHQQAVFARFKHGDFGMDVAALFDRLFDAVEGLVRAQAQPVRVVDEGIAGDARLFVVRLAEAIYINIFLRGK